METNIGGRSNGTAEIYHAPKSWTQRTYHNITYFNEVDEGGHFAAWATVVATEHRSQLFLDTLS